MRNGLLTALLAPLALTHAFTQDWKQVHKADDARWAKATGLDLFIIHKLWKVAWRYPNE